MPLNAKSVARPSAWGNPFRVGAEAMVKVYPEGRGDLAWGCAMPLTPQLAVDLYRAWQICRPENLAEIRDDLGGFDLACWCRIGDPCHADVLLELANPDRPTKEDQQ